MKEQPCSCPRCRGVKTADPKWGFDRAKVPGIECIECGRRIGRGPYVLEKALAGFGSMFFRHLICPPAPRGSLKSHGTRRHSKAPE